MADPAIRHRPRAIGDSRPDTPRGGRAIARAANTRAVFFFDASHTRRDAPLT